MTERVMSSKEWLEQPGYRRFVVLDPDGWDRSPEGWERSWNEKITEEEFNRRLMASTVKFRA